MKKTNFAKKFFLALMAVAMLGSLTSCGDKDKKKKDSANNVDPGILEVIEEL